MEPNRFPRLASRVAALTVISVWAIVCAAQAPKQIGFGLLPAEDAGKMVEQFKGIADHISAKMGLPVTVQVSESYNALIEAMRAGHLEVVYVGGSQYVKMRELGMDVVPVVTNRDEDGRSYYKACIISRSDGPIKTYADLKGRTFAFVSPTSTSGGIAPSYLLLKNGIDPGKDFKNSVYAGKHDAVVLAVKNKKVDAGAVGDLYFVRWAERGLFKMGRHDESKDELIDSELRIVGCIPVPNTPMVTMKKFGDKFLKDLQAAFVSVPKDVAGSYRVWGAAPDSRSPGTGTLPISSKWKSSPSRRARNRRRHHVAPPLPRTTLEVRNVTKSYGGGRPAIEDVSLSFVEGEFVVLLGPSGVGKSTLLRCLNLLVRPTFGQILFNGVDLAALGHKELLAQRKHIGMVFQDFNLVGRMSIITNVLCGRLASLPLWRALTYRFLKEDYQRAVIALNRAGLVDPELYGRRADTLSGGQKQRVAVARALVQEPRIILADEPIASLDVMMQTQIMNLISEIARRDHITVIMSLHQIDVAKRYADRIIALSGGRTTFDGVPSALTDEVVHGIFGSSPIGVVPSASAADPHRAAG